MRTSRHTGQGYGEPARFTYAPSGAGALTGGLCALGMTNLDRKKCQSEGNLDESD